MVGILEARGHGEFFPEDFFVATDDDASGMADYSTGDERDGGADGHVKLVLNLLTPPLLPSQC